MSKKPSALLTAIAGLQPGDPDFAEYIPPSCRDWKNISPKHFQEWVNSIGGPKRVAGLTGYSVRQFERFYSSECEIPLSLKVIVRLSDQNMKLKQRGRK
jgi:hypothetical protein